MTRQPYIQAAAVALLSGAIFCSAAYAAPPDQTTFSAMQGVKAQALSVDEMQAITGFASLKNLNDLLAAINGDPTLSSSAKTLLADYFTKFFKAVDGTKYERLFDAAYNYLRTYRYTSLGPVEP
jgi:hypothetical protein